MAVSEDPTRRDLVHTLVFPTLLFAALGAMSWAVRGSAGAGGMNACVAPGLLWGTAWWFLAGDSDGTRACRYTSSWILLALTAGFAIAGERGWMQWPHFWQGHLSTNYPKGEWTPISRAYGFLWWFIAGTAWAGLPACLLAWCGSGRPMRAWQWTLRIACGLAGGYVASLLFMRFPEVFLPLYDSIKEKYHDLAANPSLAKLVRDNGSATRHMGILLGFLLYEAVRRDWKNVVLILTAGLVNGVAWAAYQNWTWAAHLWPEARFNFGRCWEVSGGISIGIGFGLAYYLVNRREPESVDLVPKFLLENPLAEKLCFDRARSKASGASAFPNGNLGTRTTRPLLDAEWLLAGGILLLLGWTLFWPVTRDLRLGYWPPVANPEYGRGYVYLAVGAAYLVGAMARCWLRSRQLEFWGGLGLVLALGWFVQSQLRGGFSDGPLGERMTGWVGPAGVYYGVILAYCVLTISRKGLQSLVRPLERDFLNLDWLATYLGLVVILSAFLGVGMTGWFGSQRVLPTCLALIGAAFGIAYYLKYRENRAELAGLERWGAYVGLLYGLGMSLRKALKGGLGIYLGDENYWDRVCWNWIGLAMLLCLAGIAVWIILRPRPKGWRGDLFPHAYGIVWLVLITENVVAQVVTGPVVGPHASWYDFMFNMLYVLLFLITAVVVFHYRFMRSRLPPRESA